MSLREVRAFLAGQRDALLNRLGPRGVAAVSLAGLLCGAIIYRKRLADAASFHASVVAEAKEIEKKARGSSPPPPTSNFLRMLW